MTRDEYISYLTQDDTYSLDEARKLADQQFGGKSTTAIPSTPFSEEGAAQSTQATQREMKTERSKQEGGLSGFWHGLSGPEQMGLATGGLIGTGLALYGAHSALKNTGAYGAMSAAGKSIKDRLFIQKEAPVDPLSRVDPLLDINQSETIKAVANQPSAEGPPKSPYSPAEQEMLAQSEKNRIAKQVEAATKAEQGKVPGSVKPVTPAPVVAPTAPVTAAPASIATPAVQPSAPPVAPTVAQVAAETAPPVAPTVSQIVQQATPEAEGKNKGGRPKGAVSMKDTPETWQKLTKEGTTFLPGYGPGDNNLYNTYGAEGRKAILEKYNNGKPIGSYENYLKLNEKLKIGVPSSEVPALMARLPSEEEAGNFSKLGKAAKIAGVGGLLVSAANLANAKTRGERGMAGANLLEAVLPPGANITEAGAPVLPPSVLAAQRRQLEEMQKLGSPYRTR